MTFQETITFERISHETGPLETAGAGLGDLAYFTPLEWQVIALAQRDSLSSLHTPGRLALAMGSLFGNHVTAKLADSRLEVLRQVAVLVWHGRGPSGAEFADFLDARFSEDQLLLLWASVERRTSASRSGSLEEIFVGSQRAVSLGRKQLAMVG